MVPGRAPIHSRRMLISDPCLSPRQNHLRDLLSEVSERCYHAGWLFETEYEVWRLLEEPRGWGHCAPADLEGILGEIRAVSSELGEWIVWSDSDRCDNEAIDIVSWRERYAQWRSANPA